MDGPISVTVALLIGGALFGGIIGSVIAVLSWQRGDHPASRPFTAFVLAQSAWSFAAALYWLTDPFWLSVAGRVLTDLFAAAAVISWVVFTARYTGYDDQVSGLKGRFVFGFMAISFILLATNPWHELLHANLQPTTYSGISLVGLEMTPLFFGMLSVIYVIVFWSYWLMVKFYVSARAGERRQAAVILLSDVFFVAITILYYAGGYSVHPSLDPSPVFFSVTVALIAYALFYYDFLDVAPMATDLLLEEMRDPVIIVGESGVVVERNEAATPLVPYSGSSIETYLPEVSSDRHTEAQTITRMFSGEERTFDVSVSPVYDQHDQQRGRLIVLRDITVQRRKQEKLEQQNERLEEFSKVVSHDLRNPLSVASGNAELALETGDRGPMEDVVSALEEMEELIDDLLKLAREGQTIDEREQVPLQEVATDAWNQIDTRDATLEVESDGAVSADPQRFRQLLGNLYRNAIEHGDHDVTVSVGLLEERDGMYVEDDGPGLPTENRDDLFDFGVSIGSEGTGYGLAIVETIAEGHDWEATATASDSSGARFEISGMEIADEQG